MNYKNGDKFRHKIFPDTIVEATGLPPLDEECFAGVYINVGGDLFDSVGKYYDDFILANFEIIFTVD